MSTSADMPTASEDNGQVGGMLWSTDAIGPYASDRYDEEDSVMDPPSQIQIPSTDVSCASSVTTHFQEADLFVPHMYPCAQNLDNTPDAPDPTFQPKPQRQSQTRSHHTLPEPPLPMLTEEPSVDPADGTTVGDSTVVDEKRFLKEQEKLSTAMPAAGPSVMSLEAKINQKTNALLQVEKHLRKEEGSLLEKGAITGDRRHRSVTSLESNVCQKTPVLGDTPPTGTSSASSEGDMELAISSSSPVVGLGNENQHSHKKNELGRVFVLGVGSRDDLEESKIKGKDTTLGKSDHPVISNLVDAADFSDNGRATSPSPYLDMPMPAALPTASSSPSIPGAHAVFRTSVNTNDGSLQQEQQEPSFHVEDEEIAAAGQTSPQEALAEATPVTEFSPENLPVAMFEQEKKQFQNHGNKNWPFHLMALLLCLLTLTGIVVGAVCGTGHCSPKVYVDSSSTVAPTTTRDAVEAPKIEIVLTSTLGKDYFQKVEEPEHSTDSQLAEFILETRQKAFDWIINQDPMQLEYDASNLVQRFILVLLYFQTTRHKPWRECNPASSSSTRGVTHCWEPFRVDGEITSKMWGMPWLSESHECQWAGIICEVAQSNRKKVKEIDVWWNGLNGPLPWELTQLEHLNALTLTQNMLTGQLPSKLLSTEQSLTLEKLTLSNNHLTGLIPVEWFVKQDHGGGGVLSLLSLTGNSLTGNIPSEVGLLSIQRLMLNSNALTGTIPIDLMRQSALEWLMLTDNAITGRLPSEIGLLSDLEYFYAGNTGLSGSIPSEIGKAVELMGLILSNTKMHGTIPQEIYTGLRVLKELFVADCDLSGTISSSVGLLTNLQFLHLAHNNFHGTIPDVLEGLTSLSSLTVNGNDFTGSVPTSFCQNLFAVDRGPLNVVADCLSDTNTGVAAMECAVGCCTSCCDDSGVCLAN